MINLLNDVLNKKTLTTEQSKSIMLGLLEQKFSPLQVSALLGAMRVRGETAEEIRGFCEVLLEKATPLEGVPSLSLDTCGTGGDGASTFNISTAVSFVCAAAGIPVAKHGNRSVSSKCGSADVLEALGIPMDLPPDKASEYLNQHHFVFLFAPFYHQAFKHLAPIRKELGVRTVFNLLGPLLNPARASRRILGVFDFQYARPMAEVLKELGVIEAMVLTSQDGMDEISLNAPTDAIHLKNGKLEQIEIDPQKFGLKKALDGEIKGGDVKESKEILMKIFAGEKGPKQDIVAINAAAALTVCGVTPDLATGIQKAKEILDSGEVIKLLERIQHA